MDNKLIKLLQEDMLEVLKTLEDKYQVKFSMAGGMRGETNSILKVRVDDTSDEAKKLSEDNAKATFSLLAPMFGFKPSDYLRKIKLDKYIYTLTELNPNRPKNCCTIVREDGKEFKCPRETVFTNWVS